MGMIFYVLLNILCGKFKKISIVMYILATLFILKYIFIVVPDEKPVAEQSVPAEVVAVSVNAADTFTDVAELNY